MLSAGPRITDLRKMRARLKVANTYTMLSMDQALFWASGRPWILSPGVESEVQGGEYTPPIVPAVVKQGCEWG